MSKLRLTLNQRELLIARHEQARKPLCSSRQRLPLEITSSFIGSACKYWFSGAGVRVRAGVRAHIRRRDFRISRPTFRMHNPPCYLTRNAISDRMLRFAIRYCCLSPRLRAFRVSVLLTCAEFAKITATTAVVRIETPEENDTKNFILWTLYLLHNIL